MSAGARLLALSSVLAVALAGCLAPGAPVEPSALLQPLPVPGAPIAQDHDHADGALHRDSFGIALVAAASGYDGPPEQGVRYSELDVKDGWAYVCRGGARAGALPFPETLGGFVVLDVADPAAPAPAGSFDGVGCADIKVNDAGDLVIYATQRNPHYELATNAAPLPQKLPRGVYLVNVADKAAPFLERWVPVPLNGVHTVHYVHTGERELVLVQTYDWIPDGGLVAGVPVPVPGTGLNNPATQRVEIHEIVEGPDGLRDLALLGVFQLPDLAPQGRNYFPHDVTVQRHPLTGQWLGYVAYWDHGLVVVNLDDPADPRVVSVFGDTAPSAHVQVHQARPFPHLIAGRHVTVLEPELSNGDETGQFTLVDTTDPANPQYLGYWTLPGDLVIPGGFLFSPHNFNLANGRIYLAHNHAGVWVVDVGTEERLRAPVAVGYFQDPAPQRAEGDGCGLAGDYWSAFYVDGHIYASDACAGLVVLQYEGDRGLEGEGPRRVMVQG